VNGDDIRNLRAEVEKTDDYNPSTETKQLLALWVIAEQLFEVRSLLAISAERKPVQIFVNGGEVTAKGE
jgi:hypothetical protein